MKSSIEILVEYLFNQKTAENNGIFYGLGDLDVEKNLKLCEKPATSGWFFMKKSDFEG